MVYQTVYQLTKHAIPFAPQILFLIVGSLVIALSVLVLRNNIRMFRAASARKRKKIKQQLAIAAGFGLAGALFIFLSVASEVTRYQIENIFLQRIAQQDCKVVSGEVENFVTPSGGHAPEEFSVSGVDFSYYDSALVCYSTTKENGGAIKANGEQVRITYLEGEDDNFIVKLEVAK